MLSGARATAQAAALQVPLDMHAAGKGYYAPRLGYMGPDWQRAMVPPGLGRIVASHDRSSTSY